MDSKWVIWIHDVDGSKRVSRDRSDCQGNSVIIILYFGSTSLSQESGYCAPFLWVSKNASKNSKTFPSICIISFLFCPSKLIIHSQYLIERHSKRKHLTEIREFKQNSTSGQSGVFGTWSRFRQVTLCNLLNTWGLTVLRKLLWSRNTP